MLYYTSRMSNESNTSRKRSHTSYASKESGSTSTSSAVDSIVLLAQVGNVCFSERERRSHSSCRESRHRTSALDAPMQYRVGHAPKNPIVPPVLVKTPIAPCECLPSAFWMALMAKPTPAACMVTLAAYWMAGLGS